MTEKQEAYEEEPWWARFVPTLDCRSLALARIALGLVILGDLLVRWPMTELYLTDSGYLPREFMRQQWDQWWRTFNLYAIFGTLRGQQCMMVVHALCAFFLILGWRTRLFTGLCWLFSLSLLHRNDLIRHSGDQLIVMFLLWGFFLPWGRYYSIDSRGDQHESGHPFRLRSVASLLWVLQFFILYVNSGFWKFNHRWLIDRQALGDVLSGNRVTEFGIQLSEFTHLTAILSVVVVFFELYVPVLFFRGEKARLLATVSFILFHLGISLTMSIGNFPWVCIAALLGLLPSYCWTRQLRRKRIPLQRGRFDKLILSLVALMLLYVAIPMLRYNEKYYRQTERLVLRRFHQVFAATGLAQVFPLFSVPRRNASVYALTWKTPEDTALKSETFFPRKMNHHRRVYLEYLGRGKKAALKQFLLVESKRKTLPKGSLLQLWRHPIGKPGEGKLCGELEI